MLGIVSTVASPLQPSLVSEASRNQEIISVLLFIPCTNQQPTVERAPTPRAVRVLGTLSYQPGNKYQKTKSWERKRGSGGPDHRTRTQALLISAQCTDPRGEAEDHQESRAAYTPMLCCCAWGWALVDKGRLACSSLFCLTAVKLLFSKATFKKKKDDIYQNLLSGDLGGRERGRVYCLWKQAKKMRKT